MAILDIARMGHPVLKSRAHEVTTFNDPELDQFISDMKETMVHAAGIGLAAPQVFVPLRIVVFFVPADRNGGESIPVTVMINPVIQPQSETMTEDWEACLSVPGLTGLVPRWTSIRYTYQEPDGTMRERRAEGFHARVVQHECDHLDGMLYPMRMLDLTTLSYTDAEEEDYGDDQEFEGEDIEATLDTDESAEAADEVSGAAVSQPPKETAL